MTVVRYTTVANCPICSAKDFAQVATVRDDLLTTTKKHVYVSCKLCSHIYLREKPTKDSVKHIYPSVYFAFASSSKKLLFDLLKGFSIKLTLLKLQRYLPAERSGKVRLLEIGSGDGLFLKIASKNGFTAYGIEPFGAGSESAGSENYTLLNVTFENIPDIGQFDIIVLNQVIEHLPNLRKLSQFLNQSLVDGGIVAIQTPLPAGLQFNLFKSSWGGWHAPRHFHIFTEKSIKLLLEPLVAVQSRPIPSPFLLAQSLNQKFFRSLKFGISPSSIFILTFCLLVELPASFAGLKTGNQNYVFKKVQSSCQNVAQNSRRSFVEFLKLLTIGYLLLGLGLFLFVRFFTLVPF